MSCHNHIVYPPCPPTDCSNVNNYTFQNINVLGVGVYDNVTNNIVSFRGVNGDSYISVSLDNTNHLVQLTLDIAAISGGLPAATEVTVGKTRFATAAEAAAGLLDTVAITPQHFIGTAATASQLGVIQLATQAEVNAGVNTTKAVTPATLASNISTNKFTATTATAVSRAALAPAFTGQFLYQIDTGEVWKGFGTAAGDWGGPVLSQSSSTLYSDTTIDVNGFQFIFANVFAGRNFTIASSGVSGDTQMNLSIRQIDAPGYITLDSGCYIAFESGSILNFLTGSLLQDNSVTVPANSVLITSGSAGDFSSALRSTFVSSANTQTGYTAFTNPATLRTCNTATVTLQQLAQLVGTLIEDLKAIKLPAT